MSSTSYFSFPLHASVQIPSLRTLTYKQTKKRKRNDDQKEEGNSGDTTNDELFNAIAMAGDRGHDVPDSGFTTIVQRTAPVVDASVDVTQYRPAGQLAEEPPPLFPFPHRSANNQEDQTLARGRATQWIGAELASLSPPLYVSNASYTKSSTSAALHQGRKLRQRHLSALTTIFHRCVFDGDFLRAGRAWGMLLRAEAGGKGIHIRGEGRWGIGAEILLRRDIEASSLKRPVENKDGWESDNERPLLERDMDVWFTKQGFEKAKDYYERLILQYQFRKWLPHSISSLDFYPAMFGAWIYLTQSESKARSRQNDSTRKIDSTPLPNDSREYPGRLPLDAEALAKETLKDAEEIAARMDELMLSPPYSDSYQLWNLRGMVALWIGDLSIASRPKTNPTLDDSFVESEAGGYTENNVSNRDQRPGLLKNKEEIKKAKAAFEKARHRGAVIWEGYAQLFEDPIDDSGR